MGTLFKVSWPEPAVLVQGLVGIAGALATMLVLTMIWTAALRSLAGLFEMIALQK